MVASAGSSDGVLRVRQGSKEESRQQNLQRFWERIRPNCEALSLCGRLPLHNRSEDDGDGDEKQGSADSKDQHKADREGSDSRQNTRHPISHVVDYNRLVMSCTARTSDRLDRLDLPFLNPSAERVHQGIHAGPSAWEPGKRWNGGRRTNIPTQAQGTGATTIFSCSRSPSSRRREMTINGLLRRLR